MYISSPNADKGEEVKNPGNFGEIHNNYFLPAAKPSAMSAAGQQVVFFLLLLLLLLNPILPPFHSHCPHTPTLFGMRDYHVVIQFWGVSRILSFPDFEFPRFIVSRILIVPDFQFSGI